jgi:hypothetical protein
MPKLQTPIFLAREHRDAVDLVEQLNEVRVGAVIGEVIVGDDRQGWQVLVAAGDAERARSIATVLEVQRYGDWETRRGVESHWGVMEDESALRDPVEIYSAQSVVQAHLLKNLLADQGITAIVTNQLLHGGSGVDLIGTPTAAKVVVATEDAATAREFALEFDDRTQEQSTWPADTPDSEEGMPWPTCPKCGKKRTTRCPICETSGTDFTEADRGFLGELVEAAESAPAGSSCGCSGSCSPETGADTHGSCGSEAGPCGEVEADAEEDPETMLMCSVCDEPFEPAYPKHCEWCDHEFDDGYVVERIVGSEEIPTRAIAIVVILGLLALAGMAYFLVMLS